MFGPLHDARSGPARPAAYSLTLTCRSGDEGELRRALAAFVAVVERRAPKVGLLCALDRAPETGRWHVHALALVPPSRPVKDLIAWWRRCWPAKDAKGYVRPSAKAQKARPLAPGGAPLANDLDRVLSHHLGRTRKGVPIPGLPSLLDRVTACGGLGRTWARVCLAKKVPGAPAVMKLPKRPSRLKKVSTVASRPVHRWVLGESCSWCTKALPPGKREGARYCHRSCSSSASRALRAFEQRIGQRDRAEASKRVHKLEASGWLRRDALHAVESALAKSAKTGIAFQSTRVKAPQCGCGQPVAARSNATTCGRARCRMKSLRRRRRLERQRLRLEALEAELRCSYSRQAFSKAQALGSGTVHRVRARDVDKLLAELIERGELHSIALDAPQATAGGGVPTSTSADGLRFKSDASLRPEAPPANAVAVALVRDLLKCHRHSTFNVALTHEAGARRDVSRKSVDALFAELIEDGLVYLVTAPVLAYRFAAPTS